ncbi:MAG: hypothetical protein GY711_14935 [bacterium]|nr:hypothetical protein [bacterium]
MLLGAIDLARPRRYTSLFHFALFASLFQVRTVLWFGAAAVDVLEVLAPPGITVVVPGSPIQVVPCRGAGDGATFVVSPVQSEEDYRDGVHSINHFVAAATSTDAAVAATYAPLSRLPRSDASALRREYEPRGLHILETVADGDCGVDVMCMLLGRPRSFKERCELRLELADEFVNVSRSEAWQDAFVAAEGALDGADEVTPAVAVTASGPPAVAGVGGATDAAVAAGVGADAEVPAAVAVEAARAWLAAVQARVADKDEPPWDAAVGPAPSQGRKAASGALGKRGYTQRKIGTRIEDGAAVVAYARSRGVDLDGRIPPNFWRNFAQSRGLSDCSADYRQRRYLRRAAQACLQSERCPRSSRAAPRGFGASRTVWPSQRVRAAGRQGRPRKCPLVGEALFDWFCSIRASVKGRLPPSVVLTQASALAAEITADRVAFGEEPAAVAADMPRINQQWLHAWRREHRISLRRPNRKWKVPRWVLMERLHTTWLNVVRVRHFCRLQWGQDPPLWNLDQSPFYRTSRGLKTARPSGCGISPSWR